MENFIHDTDDLRFPTFFGHDSYTWDLWRSLIYDTIQGSSHVETNLGTNFGLLVNAIYDSLKG